MEAICMKCQILSSDLQEMSHPVFWGKIRIFSKDKMFDISYKLSLMETICMKCQIVFSGKNKKNVSVCCLLNLPREYDWVNWPRWLIWMRRPTGDQEVAGSTPAEVGNILSWRLIMKYFLRSFSPFH